MKRNDFEYSSPSKSKNSGLHEEHVINATPKKENKDDSYFNFTPIIPESSEYYLSPEYLMELSILEKKNGNPYSSLQYLEKYLYLMIENKDHSKIAKDFERFIVKCNILANDYLNKDANLIACKVCLEKAKNMLDKRCEDVILDEDKRSKMYISTLNNFAVYYKENEQLPLALECLKLARNQEKSINSSIELNLCAVLSEMGNHEAALEHGLFALRQLEIYCKLNHLKKNVPNFENSLIICYFNVGVEYEFLQKFQSALECYLKGLNICVEMLGGENEITLKFSDSVKKVKDKLGLNASSIRKPSSGGSGKSENNVRRFKQANSSNSSSSSNSSASSPTTTGMSQSKNYISKTGLGFLPQSMMSITQVDSTPNSTSNSPKKKETSPLIEMNRSNSFRNYKSLTQSLYMDADVAPLKSGVQIKQRESIKVSNGKGDATNLLHQSAALIQRTFRGYIVRKRLKFEKVLRQSYSQSNNNRMEETMNIYIKNARKQIEKKELIISGELVNEEKKKLFQQIQLTITQLKSVLEKD
ncbi:hypothetical protein ABK040_010700 [Willaertia magna]